MKTYDELIEAARDAISDGDRDKVSELICEALGHLREFYRKDNVPWEQDTVRSCCHEIGEMIYEEYGISGMVEIHRSVYAQMKGIAARYLEHFWNGCGDGEWRG